MREALSKLTFLIFVGLSFFPIQRARANPGAIYAATNNGVFKSTDGVPGGPLPIQASPA